MATTSIDGQEPDGRAAVWLDGRLYRGAQAATVTGIGAFDHAVLVGDGMFETCAVVQSTAFALTRHLDRLERGAAVFGLAIAQRRDIEKAVARVLDAAPLADRLRITVLGAAGPLGSARGSAQTRLLIAASRSSVPPAPTSAVVRLPWTRNERAATAGLKTTSYGDNVMGIEYAMARGADEGIFANTTGQLCEGTASNIFVERDGELLTPSLRNGPLPGITRALILEWAADAGIPAREAQDDELPWSVLDEVRAGSAALAMVGSIRTVTPVVRLDGQPVGRGRLCDALRETFIARMARDSDP